MEHNKYLEDIGIMPKDFPWVYDMEETDVRQKKWKAQRNLYGFDERETWDLTYSFACWLYSRLLMFKEVNCVDLTVHKFCVDGKSYTQIEAIDRIIYLLEYFLQDKDDCDKYSLLQEAGRIWASILPAMWW